MKIGWKAVFLLGCISIGFFTIGCTNRSSSKKHTELSSISINLNDEPHALDPRKVRDLSSITVVKALFEGLTRLGEGNRPNLALALGVEVSSDLKTYTFHLRDSFWSNGAPLLASDFVYAWKKVLDPKFLSDNAFQLYVIKNGKAIKEGKKGGEELGVTALDEKTLIVELEQSIPYFLDLLSHPVFFPVHQETDQKNPGWAEESVSYISNGPFQLEKWIHQDVISIEKNPKYWDADNVHLDQIKMVMVKEETGFRMFEKKQLHWAGAPFCHITSAAMQTLKKEKRLHTQSIAGTIFMRLNIDHPSLSNKKMRKALTLAVNRGELIEHITQEGQPLATGFVPLGMGITHTPYFKDGDDKEAKRLFNEAFKELRLKEPPSFVLTYASLERNHLMAQTIQDQWRKSLGINLVLEPVERKVYFNRISKQDYQISLASWFADFADPINFLEIFKRKNQGTNNTNWENENYASLLEASDREENQELRMDLLSQAEKILIEEMPIIPLWYSVHSYLKDAHLKGYFFSNLGYLDFKSAYLDNDH